MHVALAAHLVEQPAGKVAQVRAGGVLAVAHEHGLARGQVAQLRPHALAHRDHPALAIEVVAHGHEAHAFGLVGCQRQADHLDTFFPRERVLGRARLERGADDDHHARRQRERAADDGELAEVQALEAADADGAGEFVCGGVHGVQKCWAAMGI
ncbi:hypothetical protein D9M69_555880 [compost metagenome]